MSSNDTQFPDTIYATPEQWGSVTIYATEEGMEATIESLKNAGGAEWDSIDISNCTEHELVGPCNDGTIAYRPRHVRHDMVRDVLIMRPDAEDPSWYEVVETYDAKYDDEELAGLGINL